jgi:hypothetical protein
MSSTSSSFSLDFYSVEVAGTERCPGHFDHPRAFGALLG